MNTSLPPARLKVEPADFVVDEDLGFEPDGDGEHDLLCIRKTGANTAWVAAQLARFAGVAPLAVGYCGLKDRRAVTTQWFSVQLPGRRCDWSALTLPGIEMLTMARHSRKLKRGAHRGNAFRLLLRDVRPDPALLEQRLAQMAQAGVPNAFGAQRFGRGAGNLLLAERARRGVRLPRQQLGYALSAQRAALFNAVLDARIADGSWCTLLPGERVVLDGTDSVFGPVQPDAALTARCEAQDVHPSGPLAGAGSSGVAAACAELEQSVLAPADAAIDWLSAHGLKAQRRALRVRVQALCWQWQRSRPETQLELRFALRRGAYATSVVEHLLQCGIEDADAASADAD